MTFEVFCAQISRKKLKTTDEAFGGSAERKPTMRHLKAGRTALFAVEGNLVLIWLPIIQEKKRWHKVSFFVPAVHSVLPLVVKSDQSKGQRGMKKGKQSFNILCFSS